MPLTHRPSPHFAGGVHPPESKERTHALSIERMPFPDEVVIPLAQHIGAPARAIVEPGDRVERGDVIAEAQGFVSVPQHASATGTVMEITRWPHPTGQLLPAVRIEVDPWSSQAQRPRTIPDWKDVEHDHGLLVSAVQQGGVVGLGGAAFPTHVKLSPPEGSSLEYLLLNGCEC